MKKHKNGRNISLIAILTALIYVKLYTLDFQLQWDDYWVLVNSYTDKGFTIQNIYAVLTEVYHSQYAPLNQIYYMAINSIFGYNALYFHLFSLLLHVANAILVYFLILKICESVLDVGQQSKVSVAFFTALIFAVHPLNLEAVAWLAASKILIYAFFYLAALHVYIIYLNSQKYWHFLVCVFFFILSFGGKEQAVTLPICLMLLDYIFGRNLKTTLVWIEKGLLFSIALFLGIVTLKSQGAQIPELVDYYSFQERYILFFYTLSEYITKSLVPVKLSYIYPFPFRPGEPIPNWLYLYPISIILMLLCTWKNVWSIRWLFFGVLFFIIHIVIALHIVNLSRHSVTADRYAYLSTIGTAFISSCFVFKINKLATIKNPCYLLFSGYVLCMAIYTSVHLQVWKNSKTLKSDVRSIIRSRSDFERKKQQYDEQ